jgi:acetyltransferase-like isoleucine patch superfamily enzyme
VPHPRAEVHPSRGPRNSLHYAFKQVSRWRVAWNIVCINGSRFAPWWAMKNWMVRRSGARVGKHVSLGYGCQLDILFPGRITIEDDVILGYSSALLAHGYTHDEYQLGDVRIGKGATIGARCVVLPGVTVGERAVVGAGSVVTRDVPPGEFWAGSPAKKIR